jgi:hypothetical protein
MSAGDYRDALADAPRGVELVPLEGFPVVAAWDGDLTPAMARAGAAVHEELMLDLLVSDLLAADAGRGSQHSR